MNCRYCHSLQTTRLSRTTDLVYQKWLAFECQRYFNERTGTPFNFLELPIDIVFQVVLFRLRYKLSLRDVGEMFLLRGFEFTHETVGDLEDRFAPMLAQQLRSKRKGKAGKSWHVNEMVYQSQRQMVLSLSSQRPATVI